MLGEITVACRLRLLAEAFGQLLLGDFMLCGHLAFHQRASLCYGAPALLFPINTVCIC
jgi:hypothetical protein